MWLLLSDSKMYFEGCSAWDALDRYLKTFDSKSGLEIRKTGDSKHVFCALPSFYRNPERKLFEFSDEFSDGDIRSDLDLTGRLQLFASDALDCRLVRLAEV